jgi:ketosteroid isomerase-like protein
MDPEHRQADVTNGQVGWARDAFVRSLAHGDARSASAAYTPDARLLAPSAELFRGREAIEQFWSAGVDTGISAVELRTIELVPADGLAYEIGRYALGMRSIEGSAVVDRGMYVRVHERQADGSWLCAVEMFNPEAIPTQARAARTQGESA